MSGPFSTLADGLARIGSRRADARQRARLAELAAGRVYAGLALAPQPRRFGDFTAARAALGGELRLGGFRAPLADLTPWDIALPAAELAQRLHRFDWADDMAALGGRAARARAQGWALGWLDRFGDGAGPGWVPGTTGARLKRLLWHLPMLSDGLAPELLARLQRTLPLHLAWVERTAAEAHDDLERARALSGLLHGALCLQGAAAAAEPALAALDAFLGERVAAKGGIAGRNAEALLALLEELLDLRALLAQAGREGPRGLEAAIARIAPALRAVRLGDGSLARFHGSGGGAAGALDAALAETGVRAPAPEQGAMGYVLLRGGRTRVIADCARPPEAAPTGHASTLAFEMSVGAAPLMVSRGPAVAWIAGQARAPRTTAAHNTLALDKTSSSRLPPERAAGRAELDALATRPSLVTLARAHDDTGAWIQGRHDGYLADYGLLHERRLFVARDGLAVFGEDVLLSPDPKARRRFLGRIKGAARLGVEIQLHFHIHPEVRAELDRPADTVRLTLPSGEVWAFRHDGGLMDMEHSSIVDPAEPAPRETRQIVVRGRATSAEGALSWSLTRERAAPRPASRPARR